MKIDIEIVKATLEKAVEEGKVEQQKAQEIMSEIQKTATEIKEEEKGEKSAGKAKNRFVLVCDAASYEALNLSGVEVFVGKVPAIFPQDKKSLEDEINRGIAGYRKTKKAKRIPIKTLGDAVELVKAASFKDQSPQQVKFSKDCYEAISITPIQIV